MLFKNYSGFGHIHFGLFSENGLGCLDHNDIWARRKEETPRESDSEATYKLKEERYKADLMFRSGPKVMIKPLRELSESIKNKRLKLDLNALQVNNSPLAEGFIVPQYNNDLSWMKEGKLLLEKKSIALNTVESLKEFLCLQLQSLPQHTETREKAEDIIQSAQEGEKTDLLDNKIDILNCMDSWNRARDQLLNEGILIDNDGTLEYVSVLTSTQKPSP